MEHADFQNTIVALDAAGRGLERTSAIFHNLNAAETNEQLQALAQEIAPLLSAYSNDILLDAELFAQVAAVYENPPADLDEESQTLLEKTYKSFVRNGARLDSEQKERLREIDRALSTLGLRFGEHVLKETNSYVLWLEAHELEGLPDFMVEAAAQAAEEKGRPEAYAITLAMPSYLPFMTYSKNRERRKELFYAYNTKASKGDALDNKAIIQEILALRQERAQLLGYATYADFVLEERMAQSPQAVLDFLQELLDRALPKAQAEMSALEAFAKEEEGIDRLEKWDFAYFAEKLKKKEYAIDDALLKPYFSLSRVVEGVFETAGRLFGLRFQEQPAIPVYHPEVQAYEVFDASGRFMAVLYADFFPRAGKRNGAWMTVFKGQYREGEQDSRPHISIVCNFTKPTKSKPSLLTFQEVTTLFHEFGHALHGMLADTRYGSLSGTSVFWDFVELPSQLLENWCYEKECLDLFAQHYETGEAIPADLIEKIRAAANFHQGYQTVRQVSFGLLDMAYHQRDAAQIQDVAAFERELMQPTALLPETPGTLMSTSFSHIFQGGYAAGYYSYKWAEVLDADAFAYFEAEGIFSAEVASAFQRHILAAGGTAHPATLYQRFRGRGPEIQALLKRSGLLDEAASGSKTGV
ncbi:peptidase M3A and M3B thimet/oligopeptidase F [Nitritalea halalkaliphila LW7]|uniref:Peptidase M3A and M3B thimet/oligopeptidase F n=1 Tax=Nitritalea halalkaliphila LW7 TaxID=1189621 RepID=I5C547_9BACT|nr:M3 family metallopeptidase [Nitritalea halalkaliphila]EIM76949.1 peptidase M3A and M3B thimet/oligopeptidase F [Nitritalea halalkaliphila LW7]